MAYDKNGSTKKPRKKVRTTSGDYEEPISMGELSTWIFSGLLIIIALAVLIAYISNIFVTPGESNWLGDLGSGIVKHVIEYSFGLATVFLPILMIALAFRILKIGRIRLWKWVINCCLLTIWFSVAAELFQRFFFTESHILMGGMHGRIALEYLIQKVGKVGALAIIVVTAIAYVGYLSGETIHFIQRTIEAARRRAEKSEDESENEVTGIAEIDDGPHEERSPEEISTTIDFELDNHPEEIAPQLEEEFTVSTGGEEEVEESGDMVVTIGIGEEEADLEETDGALEPYDPKLDLSQYKYPTIDLLDKYEVGETTVDMEEQKQNKNQILQALQNFGVEISSIKATVGPTITLY